MRYYVIAGEASGDLHGSNLLRELKLKDPLAAIRCWGGEKMEAAGADLVKHYRDLAFMGFTEVLRNLPTILNNLRFCKADILSFHPDVLILIDYPGFNLRIAKWAKKSGFKVVYYISPQVWAWKENRVKLIKRCVDLMLVILPFEKAFYHKWHYEVIYVGHPLIEVVDQFIQMAGPKMNITGKTIALLPGSRRQEVMKKLPLMLELSHRLPDYTFVVAKAPGLEDEFYEDLLHPYKNVKAVRNQTYELLYQATAALVTSGTATLETALFAVPEIICYKGSEISYQIARRLIKIKYIGLVNLIMNKPVVKELIQQELNVENMFAELKELLNNPIRQAELKADYEALRNLLKKGGNASSNAADKIIAFLNPSLPEQKTNPDK
jgi:lipid-A-disaccharide synthase